MEKRLKQPPIPNHVLIRFDLRTYCDFKPTYYNFKSIMLHDKIARQYYSMYRENKITKEEMKALLLAHIKYFYDLDYGWIYGKFMRKYIEQKYKKKRV